MFRAWFAQRFGAEFPLKDIELARAVGAKTGEVFASDHLFASLEHPPMVPEFRDEPGDYAIAGFWGRSLNTYAFYFVEARGLHRRFFRIAYGGSYGDPAIEAPRVVAALARYEAWRAKYEARLAASMIIDNFGAGSAELTLSNGAQLTVSFDELQLDAVAAAIEASK